MHGDLPRTRFCRCSSDTRRTLARAFVLALGVTPLFVGALRAADRRPAAGTAIPAAAPGALAELRRISACLGEPTDDDGQQRADRGRRWLEITGRERGGDAGGAVRDLAIIDQPAGRIVSYVCFANASTRSSGEAIISLAAVSARADQVVRAFLPGSVLGLESVERYRTGGTESIYYEARYASTAGATPFLEPPVRLLLNATTGALYRLDVDPDWFAPPAPPRVRLSQKAAERIATVVLRGRDLAAAFGTGAVFGKVAAAELFTVRPNANFGFIPDAAQERARVAWVVPFRVDGGAGAGLHSLFVDAATGRILGGVSGQSAGQPSR